MTLVFSSGGILGWRLWDGIPIIACVLIAIISLVNLLENQIIVSDAEIDKIAELRNKYVNYLNQIEYLWVEFDAKRIDEESASKRFFENRKLAEDIEKLDNTIDIKSFNFLTTKANYETRNYISQHYS